MIIVLLVPQYFHPLMESMPYCINTQNWNIFVVRYIVPYFQLGCGMCIIIIIVIIS